MKGVAMLLRNLRKKYLKADIRRPKEEVHWQTLLVRLAWASFLTMYIIVKKDDEAVLVNKSYHSLLKNLEEGTKLVMFYRTSYIDENGKEYGVKTETVCMVVKERAKCMKCSGSGRYIVGVTQDGKPIDRGVCRGCSGEDEMPGTQTYARLQYHLRRISELGYKAYMGSE